MCDTLSNYGSVGGMCFVRLLTLVLCAAVVSGAEPLAAEQPFDPVKLEELHGKLEADVIEDVHAVVVDYRGERVFERYYAAPDEEWGKADIGSLTQTPTRKHDLRSVTKTVATIALGIALGDDWRADLERPLLSFFPDHTGKKGKGVEQVTLFHTLTMQAGLEWREMGVPYRFSDGTLNLNNDEIQLYNTVDPTGMVLARDVITPPGTEWYYNGGLTQIIGDVAQSSAGEPFLKLVEKRLFTPLGITDYEWGKDGSWGGDVPPAIASGLRLSPLDLAKIGKLILDRGVWDGEQIVDPEWIDAMTARHVEMIPWFQTARMNTGYGFQTYRGRLDGQDLISGVGNGDQRMMVFPQLNLVITIMAGNYNDFSQPTGELIAGAVLDAMDPAIKAKTLESEIWSTVDARTSTWVTNDFEGHMAIYHPGFRRWAVHGDKLLTKESFVGLWEGFKDAETVRSIEVLPKEIQWLVPYQVAVAHYRIDENFERDGQEHAGNLRFSDIFVLKKGRWLYAGGHRDAMSFDPD